MAIGDGDSDGMVAGIIIIEFIITRHSWLFGWMTGWLAGWLAGRFVLSVGGDPRNVAPTEAHENLNFKSMLNTYSSQPG